MGNRYVCKVFNNKIKTEKFYCIPGIFKRNEQFFFCGQTFANDGNK